MVYNLSMSRIARVVAVGYPHHITRRGNYRQDHFERRFEVTCPLGTRYLSRHKFRLYINEAAEMSAPLREWLAETATEVVTYAVESGL